MTIAVDWDVKNQTKPKNTVCSHNCDSNGAIFIFSQRPGAFAIYLEPWHADVFDFLDCKKNTGKEETRARDLFYALWIPDLFMKRVEDNADWTLMCPAECPGLDEVWGEEFEKLYERYDRPPDKRG